MEKRKIRVLVADDNMDFCFLSKEQINMFDDMICCGVAHDGNETICKIMELMPDVVLLNQFMPILDGIGVMEYLNASKIPQRPQVIITSISTNEEIVKHMLELGANYFLTKPFKMDTLAKRIRLVVCMASSKNNGFSFENNVGTGVLKQAAEEAYDSQLIDLEKTIAKRVMALGIPTNRIGYDYVRESVIIIITSDSARPTLRQIYETIAKHHGSDARCVENAIISVIKTAMQTPTQPMQELILLSLENTRKAMSNGKFLTLLSQSIQFHQSK